MVDLARHYWDACVSRTLLILPSELLTFHRRHPRIDVYAIPEVELYTRCLTCDRQPYESTSRICKLRTVFTEPGLNVHNHGLYVHIRFAPI